MNLVDVNGRVVQFLKEMMRVVIKVTGVIYIPQSAMGIDMFELLVVYMIRLAELFLLLVLTMAGAPM